MKKRIFSALLMLAMLLSMLPAGLPAAATTQASHITLTADQSMTLNGEPVWVDLNGYTLTVTGSGTLFAFDSANDTFDAEKCGKIIPEDTVDVKTDVQAPNGGRYVAVTENGETTMHRLTMNLTTVTVRTQSVGLCYKATYFCDSVLESKVADYGVALSLQDMPGADFKTESSTLYTVATECFQSGTVCVSGAVRNIMQSSNTADVNSENGKMPIYANAYIDFGNGVLVADTQNPGKTVDDESFTGVGHSLYSAMQSLDKLYYTGVDEATRTVTEEFYAQWKLGGMDWAFQNIGKASADTVDNSDLVFDAGTKNALCPVCEKVVTWTEIGKENATVYLGGKHYYLAKDLTFTGASDSGYITNASANTTACLHLNGHNITATRTRAIFGGSGRLNVMGNGTVSGYNKAAQGAAVQINNYTAGNGLYLYGGTYQKTEDTRADAHTVAIWHNGTRIHIYSGAKVIGAGTGAAVCSSRCTYANNTIGLYGCTVEGDVRLNGATQQNGKTSTVVISDATVTGTVDIPLHASGSISGAAKVNTMKIHEDSRLTVGVMKEGAQVGIRADGVFTTGNAAAYQAYFTPVSPGTRIILEGTALRCQKDYTGKLQFSEGTTDAVCPVCEKVVTWTALDDTARVGTNGGHYYLSQSIQFTGSSSKYYYFRAPAKGASCVHLNGFDITASARPFYGNEGVLNVMGSGTVSGQNKNGFGTGATVQIATGNAAGTINLYSGTYRNSADEAATMDVVSVQDNGGAIHIYEDATVEGNVSLGTAKLRNSALTIKGKVTGNVTAAGALREDYTSTLTFDNATVLGTVDINGVNTVNVVHAPKLAMVDMEETTCLTMDRLQPGASIAVKNLGTLTQAHPQAESYKQYFCTMYPTDELVVKDNRIVYKMNYTDNLILDSQGNGFCPVCKETVQWEALIHDYYSVKFNNSGAAHTYAGSHYYLPQSITYTGSDTAYIYNNMANNTVCLHLNGNNITATKTAAIFGSDGALNIMGTGTVSGKNNWGSAHSYRGSAIFLNNATAGNGISLYSGTYTMQENTTPSSVISAWQNGGRLYIYEDVTIDAGTGVALVTSTAKLRTNDIQVIGATVKGDIMTTASPVKASSLQLQDVTVTGTVTVNTGNAVSFDGLAQMGKLNVVAGTVVNFTNMKEGSSVPVSADGVFTNVLEDDYWLDYFSTSDAGQWLILRDHAVYQGSITATPAASAADKTTLDTAYTGRLPYHGEMHDHTSSGFKGDGKNTLQQWKTEMARLDIDFATIVDHKQSTHMYLDDWDDTMFVGGSEPATTVSDSKALAKTFHFNMIFSDPKALEEAFSFAGYNLLDDGQGGKYFAEYTVGFKTARYVQFVEKIYALGGLLVHVHPKYNSYMVSDDPLDYYFGSDNAPMGIEITTGSGGNMAYRDNEEAYQLWVDLLEAGKWAYATAGSDKHALPNPSALTTLYSAEKKASAYMNLMRSGDFAPGWVGIRMAMGDVTMGGKTDFTGKKLVFSVGDIYTGDKNEAKPVYVADHTYRMELYDDKGILSQQIIDPTQTTYFSIDANASANFYRVVIWDDTAVTRVAVGNPIWNTK